MGGRERKRLKGERERRVGREREEGGGRGINATFKQGKGRANIHVLPLPNCACPLIMSATEVIT